MKIDTKGKYVIGYTVNGYVLGVVTIYGMPALSWQAVNVFSSYKIAEKFYKEAVKKFKNDKEWYTGGKVWIRKLNSPKHPFILTKEPFYSCGMAVRCELKKPLTSCQAADKVKTCTDSTKTA